MQRDPEDPREASLTCLKIEKIEAFSRPFGGAPLFSSASRTRQRIPAKEAPWRTVIEPTAGTILYSFAPQQPLRHRVRVSDSAEQDLHARCGLRRVSIEDFSLVRAVVRPSDVDIVVRSLMIPGGTEKWQGNIDSKRSGTSASSCSGESENSSSTSSARVSMRGSGAGWIIKFEDDSGRHFVSAPGSTNASSSVGDGGERDRACYNANKRFPRASGYSQSRRCSLATDEDQPWQQGVDPSACPLGIPIALPEDGGGIETPKDVLNRTCQRRRFPQQPVVEVSVGEWRFRYSRDSRGGVIDEGIGDVIETAMLSMSSVRVVDLLQRQPCHAAFRQLLVIAPSGVSRRRSSGSREPAVSRSSLPPAGENSDWMRDRLQEGYGRRCGGKDESVGDGGFHVLEEASSPTATSAGSAPSVLVDFRRVLTRSARTRGSGSSTSVGGGGTQAPAESSREKGEASSESFGGTDGSKSMDSASTGFSASTGDHDPLRMPATAEAPAERTGSARELISVSIKLGDPVKANWNPRTMVALWSLRAALSAAAAVKGEGDPCEVAAGVIGSEHRVHGGAGAVQMTRTVGAGTTGAPLRSCSTEIFVVARDGIEVCGVLWQDV